MAKAEKPITRLEELEVKEVSIVDRPANLRRFLTVKSEDGMALKGPEITVDDQGNLVAGSAEPKENHLSNEGGSTSTTSIDQTDPSLSEIFKSVGHNLEVISKRLSISPEIRTEVFRSLGDAMSRLNSVIATTDMAQTDRGDKPSTLTPILAAELLEVSKVIASTAKLLGSPMKKSEDSSEIEEFVSTLSTLSTQLDSIEKAGAKMSKGRLEQFEKAISLLGKILSEIRGSEGMDQTPATVEAKKMETRVYKAEELEGIFSSLTSKISQLTETVKKSNSRIALLETRRGTSNTIPVEKSRNDEPNDDQVYWPMDMNSEKTRNGVDN